MDAIQALLLDSRMPHTDIRFKLRLERSGLYGQLN